MITNFETNKVYLAKGMISEKYVNAMGHLSDKLNSHEIRWGLLPYTTSSLHIWARDYMPIQVSKRKFVCFNYSPNYLEDYPEYKPDKSAIHSKFCTILSLLASAGMRIRDFSSSMFMTFLFYAY